MTPVLLLHPLQWLPPPNLGGGSLNPALGIRALAAAIGAQPDIEKRGDKQVPHVKLQFARITRDDVDDDDLVEE